MAEEISSSSEAKQEQYGLVVLKSFGNLGEPKRDCSLATGVAFNRTHEVVVADPSYNRIQIFNKRGRLQRVIKSSTAKAGKLVNPSKVAVNLRNGAIYVTERASNLGIKRFNSNGFFVRSFGEHDDYCEARALTFDQENNVLLLEQEQAGLVFMSIFNENGQSYRHRLFRKFTSPNGLAAWDGKIYVSDEDCDSIKILDYNGKQVGQFERITQRAFGVCMSEDGEVLVGAKVFDGFRLTKFKTDGTIVSVHNSRTYHHDIRNMAIQGDCVVLATGDGVFVYVPKKVRDDLKVSLKAETATLKRRKMKVFHTFALRDNFGSVNTRPRGVTTPSQCFLDNVYVSDLAHGRIQMFDSSGLFLGQFDARLKNPRRLNVDRRTNNILVIDNGPPPLIVIFNSTGELINKIGFWLLNRPINLAVDKHEKIFVIEYGSISLKVFDLFGSELCSVNCKAARFPTAIDISEKEEIFMTESDYHHIQVYNYSGELLRRIGNYSITRSPLFVAIVRKGLIVVADLTVNINLTYFTEEGQFVAAYQSNLKHISCNDIAVMPDESIVVASDGSCCQIYIYRTNVNE